MQAGDDDQIRVQDEIEQFHRGFVGQKIPLLRHNRRSNQPPPRSTRQPKGYESKRWSPYDATTMTGEGHNTNASSDGARWQVEGDLRQREHEHFTPCVVWPIAILARDRVDRQAPQKAE